MAYMPPPTHPVPVADITDQSYDLWPLKSVVAFNSCAQFWQLLPVDWCCQVIGNRFAVLLILELGKLRIRDAR